jgi:hypothetical protein
LALVVLVLCTGCGPTLRKTVAATTASAELTARVTGDACTLLATKLCKVNPCPDLERCHKAEALAVQGAKALTEAGKLINTLPKEVTDARR